MNRTVPLPVALAFLVVCAFAGWSVGGIQASRKAAFDWTYAGVTFEAKGDRR